MEIRLYHTSPLHKNCSKKEYNICDALFLTGNRRERERALRIIQTLSAHCSERAGQHCLRTAAPGVSKWLLIYFSCYMYIPTGAAVGAASCQNTLDLHTGHEVLIRSHLSMHCARKPHPQNMVEWRFRTRSSSNIQNACVPLYGICVHTADAGGKHHQQGSPGI